MVAGKHRPGKHTADRQSMDRQHRQEEEKGKQIRRESDTVKLPIVRKK